MTNFVCEIPFPEAVRATSAERFDCRIGEYLCYRAQDGANAHPYAPSDILVLRNAVRVFSGHDLIVDKRGLKVVAIEAPEYWARELPVD